MTVSVGQRPILLVSFFSKFCHTLILSYTYSLIVKFHRSCCCYIVAVLSIFVIVFDLDLVCRSSEKAAGGGGEVEEDIQLPPPDAQFNKDSSSSSATAAHKKSKREKKHKKQKPYSKRPSKIQHLDPIFICKF